MRFLIISVFVFNIVAYFIPKRLSKIEIWTTCLFATFLGFTVDVPLDLYGFFEKGFQWVSYLIIFGLYPSSNTIFLNYYPFRKSILRKVIYFIGLTIFCLSFEVISYKIGYFYYNGWNGHGTDFVHLLLKTIYIIIV